MAIRPRHLRSLHLHLQSVAISGNQWQSVAISGNQWHLRSLQLRLQSHSRRRNRLIVRDTRNGPEHLLL